MFTISLLAGLMLMVGQGHAQETILNRGDLIVTGFAGVKPADAPLPQGASPLDEFFIDLDAASAQILSLAAPGGAPEGQLISAPSVFRIKARDVGQVFATTLDDGAARKVPNIYLGQSAAYGLYIVTPDADGDGAPERSKTGAAEATWMDGQFGAAGGPGAIYKVDGQTGSVSLFTTLPDNSGPGIGDVVFDRESRQFFASDLDKGLIYRISETGEVLDSFDHGVAGRPAKQLSEIADDGSKADIENAAFDTGNPESWGFTQEERRVHSLAIQNGRLYYAVNGQVWSVGVSDDGFGADVRWELDAKGMAGDGPITDMLFDRQGRLYLAQRGEQRASYDYSVFTEPQKAAVVRYRPEDPDDTATESVWVAEPEEYAIGLPPEHRHAEGGIALGYPHDENGGLRYGACGETLWSTGHRLRPGALAEESAEEKQPEADVHGLQGNAVSLVRPENVPPTQSYFVDYDGFFGDATKSGHMGDVEIWQPCEGAPDFAGTPSFGELPPGILPPGDVPPELPPEFPPDFDYETNLKLTKRASPKTCSPWFGGWLCQYRVRVRNTGPDHYFGPILVEDWLPANPAGAAMGFEPTPPWNCWSTGASAYKCFRPGVFLAPGASVSLKAYAWVPKSYDKCHLRNHAAIEWAPGGSQWNSDPTDDFDSANALIPSKECDPKKDTDLKIRKWTQYPCWPANGKMRCHYNVSVENQGPGDYVGNIVVDDTVPAGTTAAFGGAGWACGGASPNYTCTFAGANLNPGEDEYFSVIVDVTPAQAKQMNCRVPNQVKIVHAPSPTPQNTDPTNDTSSVDGVIPDQFCKDTPSTSDLKIYKRPLSCYRAGDNLRCAYQVTVRNLGPGVYNGDIKVDDTVPGGMTAWFSGAGWNCGGANPTYTCTRPNVNLPVFGGVSFFVRVDFSQDQARELNCRIPNQAKITEAPGGSPKNTNAGNDTANAVGAVPVELCRGDRRNNLRIEKIASPKFCTRSGNDWWCQYAIRVINTGPALYAGPLEVEEALPAEPLAANWNAPWNCAGIGGAGAVCTHPFTVIPVNHTRILALNVKFSGDVVKEKNCGLANVAKITKAVPGTPKNTNSGDDIAGASALVPAEFCRKEPTNLLLMKQGAQPECNGTGGGLYRCPFNVIVRNVGLGKYDGPITVRDYMLEAPGVTIQVPAPWNCVGAAPSVICKHPAIQLNPGQQVVMPVWVMVDPSRYRECSINNSALILQAPGGSVQNQQIGDDKASAMLQFPPQLVDGKVYCNRPEPVSSCPPGFNWSGERCERIGISTPPPPPPPGRECPAGTVGTYPDCDQIGDDDPERECPRGTVGDYPNCRKIDDDPDPKCTGGRLLIRGECFCPRPRIWNGERCVRRTCPEGTRGIYPNCRKIVTVCPPGFVGKPPHCRKIERTCPRGFVGKPPNCRKIQRICPPGFVGRPPRCRKLELQTPNLRQFKGFRREGRQPHRRRQN
jgi:hypothetical protein